MEKGLGPGKGGRQKRKYRAPRRPARILQARVATAANLHCAHASSNGALPMLNWKTTVLANSQFQFTKFQ
jgi:hypothetical protein